MKLLVWLIPALLACMIVEVTCKKKNSLMKRSANIQKPKKYGLISKFGIRGRNKKKKTKVTQIHKDIGAKKLFKIDNKPEENSTFDVPEKASSGEPKKNAYHIDPVVFDKLKKVNNMEDFIRIFKPSGYEIRKEPVIEDKSPPSTDNLQPLGRKPEESISGIQALTKNVVYFENRKISSDSAGIQKGCAAKFRDFAIPPKPGVAYYPWCISLKKCSGCCQVSMECVTTSYANRTISVFVIDGKTYPRPVPMKFLEDATCECQCIVKSTDCLPRQTYNERRCQCECNRSPENCLDNRHWSISECDCICSNRRTCKSRLKVWDEKTCSCACITDPCPQGTQRNKDNCRCASIASDATFRADNMRTTEKSLSTPSTTPKNNAMTLPSIDDVFSDDGDFAADKDYDDDYNDDYHDDDDF